jgi:phosphatidylserine decarboxylase
MSLIQLLKPVLVPINRDGWPFIAAFAVVAVVLALVWQPLGWIGLLLTAWCTYFFRDPPRIAPTRPGLVVSPADGIVQMIQPAVPPEDLGLGPQPLARISIFMNVFDVHVNRSPVSGTVANLAYRPGKFFNASLDKASEFNERQAIRLRLEDGQHLVVVQIAGLVARRIRCDLKQGQAVRTGERFGLIRFGSRLDVYLPEGVSPLVAVGQTTIAGETVIADLTGTEAPRHGEER